MNLTHTNTTSIPGYTKRAGRGDTSLSAGKIDDAPDSLDLCRLRVGAGIAKYQHYLAKKVRKSIWQEEKMIMRTDADQFKSVFWRKDGQKIKKLVFNDLIGQWVSQSVAKCSCERRDADKCPANGNGGKRPPKRQNDDWLDNYGLEISSLFRTNVNNPYIFFQTASASSIHATACWTTGRI